MSLCSELAESLPCFSRLAEKETQPASISLTVCTLAERKCDTGKLPGHRATLTKLAITVPGCRSRSGNLCPGDVPADLCRLYGVPRKMPMKTGEFKITSELNEREGAKSWIAATWSATWLQLHISPALLAKVVKLATLLGEHGKSPRIPSIHIRATHNSARYARCNVHDTSSAVWDNNRQKTRNSRLFDVLQQSQSPKVPWLDNCSRSAWPWVDVRGHPSNLAPESVKKLCQQGHVKEAVKVLETLVRMNSGIDKYQVYSVLKECMVRKDVTLGGQVHALAVRMGFASNTFLCNHFIRMYAGHGNLQQAMAVFTGVVVPDVFMWASIISAHVKQGQAVRAIQLYQQMRATGMKPNGYVLVAALQACAAAGELQLGKQLHSDVLTSGMAEDMFVCNCLVDMYAKCGSLKDARRVFDGLGERDVVTWNSMIAGYARVEGMGQEALRLHSAMMDQCMVIPDAVTFLCLLKACASVGVSALEKGKQLHSQLQNQRLDSDMAVSCTLVHMYVKCGSLKDARMVFDQLGERDVVTWTAMIAGYAKQDGMGQEALNLYDAMYNEGMAVVDVVTVVCLLQACASVGASALETGKQLHSLAKDHGLECDVVVGCGLVHMYAKCGSVMDARGVFDNLGEKDVVAWTAMIAAYAQQEGMGQNALDLYGVMHNEDMIIPDVVTLICLLQACANVGVSALNTGKQLHSQLEDRGLESDVSVGASLVNMYVKCGSHMDARIVFDRLSEKNVVTWTAIIAGYAHQEGMGQEALNIYRAMCSEGITTPDAVIYACLLEACGNVGAVQQGRQLQSEIFECGLESNVLLGNCLVKMYAKCGRLDVSRQVFDRLPVKNLVTWTALLKGYAEHGEGSMAIQCFEELLEQGLQPNEVTYTCLLTACSHAGLVDEGRQYFNTMVERHGFELNDQLYCCMVDLLGRSGHLDKAEQMLRASGLAGNAVSWTALLSACKGYGDVATGRRCFEHLLHLDPTVATPYVLLGSIYANAGRWDEAGKVEMLRRAAGAGKVPGKACIEVKEEVHEFTVGEERLDVAATLRKMNTSVKECGHVPQTQLVLRSVSEQEKEDALCGHAEKLALAYGLLNTPAGSSLMVTKNLRMCNDCHSSTKILSRLENREIVVRDGHKVHRFQNGACSCRDRP